MMRRVLKAFALLLVALGVGGFLFYRDLQAPGGKPQYVRVDPGKPLPAVLSELEAKGVVKSAQAAGFLARLAGRKDTVATGTYRVSGGFGAWSNLRALSRPMSQMVRLPETNFSPRDARLLEKKGVCTAAEYLKLVKHPEWSKPGFPLPTGSLEGYLYPDTYDLPPLLGAKGVIGRRLRAFDKKVWEPLGHPANLEHIIKVASLVQLEAGPDVDKPMIAGVIENRLRKHMRLQIDASLLYGMGKWRTLTFKDYREYDSPYNLYRVAGLPPTPICSPSIKCIRAAMHPASHNYLYYVALPNGYSLYAATYEEHKKNIEKRKAALRALGR